MMASKCEKCGLKSSYISLCLILLSLVASTEAQTANNNNSNNNKTQTKVATSAGVNGPQTRENVTIWDRIVAQSKAKACGFPPIGDKNDKSVCQIPVPTANFRPHEHPVRAEYDILFCMTLEYFANQVCSANLKVPPVFSGAEGVDICDRLEEGVKLGLAAGLKNAVFTRFVNDSRQACSLYCIENGKSRDDLCRFLDVGLRAIVATEKEKQGNNSNPQQPNTEKHPPVKQLPSSSINQGAVVPTVKSILKQLVNDSRRMPAGSTKKPIPAKSPVTPLLSGAGGEIKMSKTLTSGGSSGSSITTPANNKQVSNQLNSAEVTVSKEGKPASASIAPTKSAPLPQITNESGEQEDAIQTVVSHNKADTTEGGDVLSQLDSKSTVSVSKQPPITVQQTTSAGGEMDPRPLPNQEDLEAAKAKTVSSNTETIGVGAPKTNTPIGKVATGHEGNEDYKDDLDDQDMKTGDMDSANDIQISKGDNGSQADEDETDPVENVNNANVMPVENPKDFPQYTDSHFFTYFLTVVVLCIVVYLVFHNKQKIIALIIEGRHERRRRPNTANYKKLDSNLEEVMQGGTKGVTTAHVIY